PEPPKPKPKPEPPKPQPAPPKPPPAAEKPPPPPPPPPPAPMKPRESGPDEKTEAAKSDQPKTELPKELPVQPKAEVIPPPPEPLPPPPEPKPAPPRTPRKSALGRGVIVPVEPLPEALRPQRPSAPAIRNLVLRLPSPGSGSGTRDLAGDAYLNRLKNLLERNRLYPPAEAFADATSRQAVYGVVIAPAGTIVNIKLLSTTGSDKLDEAAREMITNSSPFPPVPPDYPQIRTYLTVVIPIYPRGG
ncbi:MAG TPA: TonB family protein, partial [Stellaceae bacterium]